MLRRLALALPLSLLSACGSLIPHDRGAIRPQAQATPRAVAVAPANRLCLAELGVRRASFAPLPDRYFDAGCSTVGAVSLTGLQGDEGRFEIANLGAVACPLAETLAAWARFGVEGHFHARHPWFSYHERFGAGAASVVGARLEEVRLVRFTQRERLFRQTQGAERKGARLERPDAVFRGTLVVEDAVGFRRLLERGVGRHRAFGFGMLLLRPAGT